MGSQTCSRKCSLRRGNGDRGELTHTRPTNLEVAGRGGGEDVAGREADEELLAVDLNLLEVLVLVLLDGELRH